MFIHHGRCVYRNRCLRVKAAFAGSAKFPANTAFAARAAITVATVVVVVVVAVEGKVLVLVATAVVIVVVDPVDRFSLSIAFA